MKRIKLIYNPHSGDKSFKDFLDDVVSVLQKEYEVHLVRCQNETDIEDFIADMKPGYYDAIAVSGGDGTLNRVVNAMLENGLDIPIGIFPSGTANDFATHLCIPKDIEEAAEVIVKGKTVLTDIGYVNGKYFINVCGAGLLTNISQNIDLRFKNIFGKMGYYLKGLEQLPNFEPLPVRITNSNESFEEDIYLFIVLNTSGTGGFEQLSADSSICDGLFEFIAIKAKPMMEIAVLFFKILQRDYLSDSNIIYFQDNYIKVELLTPNEKMEQTDIDGEAGPDLPIEIENLRKKIRFFYNEPC